MARRRSSDPGKKTGRRPGRPRKTERPITPAVIEEIGILWLQNVSMRSIAKKFKVDEKTIRYHLENTILPLWHDQMRSRLAEDLAKVALVEKTAWERFHNSAPSETHEQVEKALLEGGGKPRIVKQATRKVTKTGEVAWIQVIQWCIDFRARIHAHYAPKRHHVDHGSELRVAGLRPDQVDQAMLKRLMETIEDRRRYQQGLEPGQN